LLNWPPKIWLNNLIVSSSKLLHSWKSVIAFIIICDIFIVATLCFFPFATTIIATMQFQCNNGLFNHLRQQQKWKHKHTKHTPLTILFAIIFFHIATLLKVWFLYLLMYFFATISYQKWCTKNVSSPSMDLCVYNKRSDCKNWMSDEFKKVTK